jgi:hypothetical protein
VKFLPKLQGKTDLLRAAHKTAIEAFQESDKQLSFLSKECGDAAIQALISLLLKKVFSLTLTPVNKTQLVQMAGEIQSSFWMLRFDEIVFALKSGINGDYGEVYGHINYQHVAKWLNKYIDGRGQMIENIRDKKHERATSPAEAIEYLKLIPSEHIEKIAIKAEEHPMRVKTPTADVRKNLDDGAKLVFLEKHGTKMKLERLVELRDEAEVNGWKRTMDHVNTLLKKATSFTIKAIAKKIAAGITDFTPSELQAQKNYPKELEIELKLIADATEKTTQKENPKEEKHC